MTLSHNKVKCVPVAIDKVVNYDLQSFKLTLKDDFSLESLLKINKKRDPHKSLVSFSYSLTDGVTSYTGNFDRFVDLLVDYFQHKARVDVMHEPEQLQEGFDQMKLALIKLQLQHDHNLSDLERERVKASLGDVADFSALIDLMRKHWNGK